MTKCKHPEDQGYGSPGKQVSQMVAPKFLENVWIPADNEDSKLLRNLISLKTGFFMSANVRTSNLAS
jgi:hypothetical protein